MHTRLVGSREGVVRALIANLGRRAMPKLFDQADHAFHVPAKSGRTDSEVLAALLDAAAEWMARHQPDRG